MLTKLTIRNFKRFEEVELGSPVAFIGPNNAGKTSAMQALALWEIGLNPNPPKDPMDGVRTAAGWVRELQGRWLGSLG